MDLAKAFLLIAVLSCVEAFPVSQRQTSIIQKSHRLFSSPGDEIVGNSSSIDANQNERNKEESNALSGLLGEMFQAKLEISQEKKELESLVTEDSDMPVRGNDGIYRIINQNQLENFKAANSDKLVFLKFSSPICAACRMLKQKFQTLHRSQKFADAPVVFADIIISNNKRVNDPFRDYITSQLQVRRVPSIHFYAWGSDALADQIYCDDDGGCSWPKIQQQMLDFMGRHYKDSTPTPEMTDSASSAATIAAADSSTSSIQLSKREKIRRILSLSWLR